MALELHGTNGITYPSWTTATRPSTPQTGQVGLNTTISALEMYTGTQWTVVGNRAVTFGYNLMFGT